jgi:2-polyprenyl-6-methoxyphenol hydroxylase-like FAD-dependent oxidoreductase
MSAQASGDSTIIRSHVVIVGAGPAGAALSFLLARRGIGVTLVERQTDFTREFRGEALMPTGVEAIRQMGLGAGLDALPHTEIRAVASLSEALCACHSTAPAIRPFASGWFRNPRCSK